MTADPIGPARPGTSDDDVSARLDRIERQLGALLDVLGALADVFGSRLPIKARAALAAAKLKVGKP